jgi:outer membrane protein assembly factor BamA
VVLESGPPAEIGELHLEGISGPFADTLRGRLRLESGDRFREQTVRERIAAEEESLRKDGYFELRLTLEAPVWDSASNRVRLVIKVHEGPRYRLEFRGVESLRESTLRDRLSLWDAGSVDETEISTSARQIEAAYRESGYHFVQVSGVWTRSRLRRHPVQCR